MAVTLQDITNQLNDYIRNYTTGSVDLGNRSRAINRAIEYYQRRLGLPSDEKIFTFLYNQDQLFYDLPVGFNEPIMLMYDNPSLNKPGDDWQYRTSTDILQRTGNIPRARSFGTTSMNGKNQLVVYSANMRQGYIMDTFDDPVTAGWTGQGDSNSLVVDTNQKIEGTASLRFDITPSSGRASLYRSGLNLDISTINQNNGYYKLYVYLTTNNFTSIDLNLFTDSSNYYKISATTQDDGTPFVSDAWNKIGFPMGSNLMIGSPNDLNIIAERIDFNEGIGFVGAVDMRVDHLYTVVPDLVDLVYYSAYKGTDATGVTPKVILDDPTDICYFGEFAADLIDIIAKRAATSIMPQLRQDKNWYNSYKEETEESIKIWGKIYPRKRIVNFGKTMLKR